MCQGVPALRGWPGEGLHADSIENLGCSSLDVFETFVEELRIAAVQTDIILRRSSSFEVDSAADDECDGLGLSLAEPL